MHLSPRSASLGLFFLGFVVLAWLLYDATTVQIALGLRGVVSEGVVASAGLLVVAVSLGGGFACWRTARRQPIARDAV